MTMIDLTKGNPAKGMLMFALPVAFGNLFQLFYSLADTRIVGSTLGVEALAAVGATTSVSTLLIGFMNGLTNGFAILTAQRFGAGEQDEVRRFGALSFGLGILMSVCLAILSIAGLGPVFTLLNVPESLAENARIYITIILLGIPSAMAYNGCAGILRAVGDTKAPLAFLVLSSLLNVGLDLVFILQFHMGVGGAAWATVLSQTVSALLSFFYMWKTYPFFRFRWADFAPEKTRVRRLLSSGLSMALMMSLVFFGTLALQCAINTFGTNTIVAHTGARKITEFYMLPFSVMSVTMATYCGQNLGAGKEERIRQGVGCALGLVAACHIVKLYGGSGSDLSGYGQQRTGSHKYCFAVFENRYLILFCSSRHCSSQKCLTGNRRSCNAHCIQFYRTGRKSGGGLLFNAGFQIYGNYCGRAHCVAADGDSAGYPVFTPSGLKKRL